MDRILEESSNTEELSSERYCNGIAGVPITFLDKYSPEQFEIVNANDYQETPESTMQEGQPPEQFEIVNANDYRKTENVPVKSHGLIKDKDASITSESKKETQKTIDKKDSKNIIAKSRAEQSRAEQRRTVYARICIRKKL